MPPSDIPLKKILHVDDDQVMRLMTKTALLRSSLGYEVESCLSAKEALEKIQDFVPDLLLIDMIMPIVDGPSLVERIRKIDASNVAKTPVIFITGKDNVIFEDREALEPVLGIIQKPFSAATLGDDLMALWKKRPD